MLKIVEFCFVERFITGNELLNILVGVQCIISSTEKDFKMSSLRHCNRGFHKLDEIGNNANIGIRCFTT